MIGRSYRDCLQDCNSTATLNLIVCFLDSSLRIFSAVSDLLLCICVLECWVVTFVTVLSEPFLLEVLPPILAGNSSTIFECPQPQDTTPTATSSSTWVRDRPKRKGHDYYNALKELYKDFIAGNELLSIASVMEAVNTRNISLLTTDVKSRKFNCVSRGGM